MTWVMVLGRMVSQWRAPSPDRYLNIDAPSLPQPSHWRAVLCCCCVTLFIPAVGDFYSQHRQQPTCPHCWSRSRCVRARARAAVPGEDARAPLPINRLHPGVWPPPRRGWALCRPISALTPRGETSPLLQSEGGKSRIPERPSLQVNFATQSFFPQIFSFMVAYCLLHRAA